VKKSAQLRRGLCALAAAIGFGIAGQSQAQVNFSVPADAPDGGAGTIGILQVTGAGGIGDQNAARAALNGVTGVRTVLPAGNVFNFKGDGGAFGHFGSDIPLPAGDDKSYIFRGNIQIPSAGTYTFNVNSDDGFTLAFNGGTVPWSNAYTSDGSPANTPVVSYNGNANGALTFFGGRGAADTGGQVTFGSAGVYHFDMTFHDGCCDDSVEVSAAQGAKTAFGASFALVGGSAAPSTKFAGQVGPFSVAVVHGNNANNLNDAITDLTQVLNGDPIAPRGGGTPQVAQATSATINYVDPQNANSGGHGPSQTFPGDGGGDDNNFSTGAIANLTIPAGRGGHYSYMVYSDDSARLRFINLGTGQTVPILGVSGNNAAMVDSDGVNGADALTNDGNCCNDIIGRWDLQPGNYRVEIVNNEQGGGAGLFLYGAPGDQTTFDSNVFQLLGENLDVVPGGLQLVAAPEPGTLGLLAVGTIGFLARRKRA
jgi:hypothetical protein